MGTTLPLVVASVICTLLAGEAVSFTRRATQPGELQVDGVVQGNTVFFNWSRTPEPLDVPVYEIRYKTKLLACSHDGSSTPWNSVTDSNIIIPTSPYAKVTLEVRIVNTTETTAASLVTPGKVPTTKVMRVVAHSLYIQATIDGVCSEYNGPGMHVQFVLKLTNEKRFPVIRIFVTIHGRTAKLHLGDLNLLPFTNYTLTAIPANSIGVATNNSLFKEATIITKPEEPGKVRNLQVVNASTDSLKVTWSAPDDDPPRGVLEKYVVHYMEATLTAGGVTKHVNENTTSLVIRDLQPDTAYIITVEAKNRKNNYYSDAVQVVASTTEERVPSTEADLETTQASTPQPTVPSFAVSLQSTAGDDTTTLLLNWTPLWMDTAHFYMASLHDGETCIREINTTSITVMFDQLTAGKKYVARVKACNTERICSNYTEVIAWTRPNKPRVTETQQSLARTTSTITMQLPTLENPPGIHWVLLKRYDKERSSCNELTENIKRKAEDTVRQASMANQTEVPSSLNRGSRYDTELHIVKTIEVEADWDGSDMYVLLGGDGNSPLKRCSDYVAVVVTETKAGDYSEYYTCDPLKFKTQPYKEEAKALRVIGGTIYVLPL